jgi:hypothetical protein
MLDPNLPELKVLDYTQALQRAQTLESRGDFQSKGIYKLTITIYEWTEKFGSNKILPTQEQLERDLSMEPEKLEYFLAEYAIRARPPLLKKLNYLDFTPTEGGSESFGPDRFLRHSTVFCRPTSADGTTCYRYVTGLNDVSFLALKRWIQEKRQPLRKEYLRETIFEAVDQNRLLDTYASTEIGGLFNCPFDKSKVQKDSTIIIHLKPILKKLVEERLLFFQRNDRATRPGNKSVFYYFNQEEIFHRLEVYLEYMKERIIPDLVRIGVMTEIDEIENSQIRSVAEGVLKFLSDSYGDQKTLVEEIILLADFYNQEMEKVAREEAKKIYEELVFYIKTAGKIIEVNNLRIKGDRLDEETRNKILAEDFILYSEYADKSGYFEYILHRDSIPEAIQSARNQFLTHGNDSEITILRLMNAIHYVDEPSVVGRFEEAESRALFRHLPFFTWIWRLITGNKVVHKFEADGLRRLLDQKLKNKIADQRAKFQAKEKIRKEQEALEKAREKVQKAQQSKQNADSLGSTRRELLEEESWDEKVEKGWTGSGSATEPKEEVLDPKEKESLDKIIRALDEAWEFGHYPDREYLLNKMENSFGESDLIQFLKKRAGKEIYSYLIRNQSEKYPFPILVSKQYLKKNGKKLKEKSEQIINEQKNQVFPDQFQFDLNISLVEFLDRVLPKLR